MTQEELNKWQELTIQKLTEYGLDKNKAIKITDRFVDNILSGITEGIHLQHPYQRIVGYVPIDKHNIRRSIGRVQFKKKQIYVYDLIQELNPMFEVTSKGNNLKGERTVISAKELLELAIQKDELVEDTIARCYKGHIKALQDHEYEKCKVHLTSLSAYIERTKAHLKENPSTKLLSYLKTALDIHKIATETGGFIFHIPNKSKFGRTYYNGLSLQHAPKVVRHAALGKCKEIDVNNSVFTWKLQMGKDFGLDTFQTEMYLERKDTYRQLLADKVFEGVRMPSESFKLKLIKKALTSITFGAKAVDTSYWGAPALKEVFTPKNSKVVMTLQLNKFLQDDFVKSLIQEQELISDTIYKSVKDDFKNVEEVKDGRGISKNKVIAWLYQQHEAEVMSAIINTYKDKILLQCHDAVYGNFSNSDVLEIKEYFQTLNIQASVEHIDSYSPIELSEQQEEELTHKQQIAKEEYLAQGQGNNYTAQLNYQEQNYNYDGTDSLIQHIENSEYNQELLEELKQKQSVSVFNDIMSKRLH